MAWSDLTFTGCSVLTAGQMTQLQANFGALAAADSGAPSLSRVWMNPGSATHGWVRPKLLVAQGGISAGQAEGWHEVGAAGEPAFLNGWVNFEPTNYSRLRFIKLATGLVLVRGLIKDGTIPDAMCILPVGYRPLRAETFPAVSGGVDAKLEVWPDGSVLPLIGSNVGFAVGAVFLAEG